MKPEHKRPKKMILQLIIIFLQYLLFIILLQFVRCTQLMQEPK